MDQVMQDRLRVAGGVDVLKETLDETLQKMMNLQGTVYLLNAQLKEAQTKIAELTPKANA